MSDYLNVDGVDLLVTVNRIEAYVPVTTQQLVDAGLPLPPGMEPPQAPLRPSLYRRWRWACLAAVRRLRERVGFWIAGREPDNDWDW